MRATFVSARTSCIAFLLAAAAATSAAAQSVSGPDTVVVRSGPLTLRGLLWRPAGRGPFPAVLFNHGSGPTTEPRRPATLGPLFARHGYVFLFLFRRGAGLSSDQGTNSAELMARAFAEKGQAGRNDLQLRLLDAELGDVQAALAFLRTRPEVDGRRVGVAGHSFGGSISLVAAERDTSVRAAVLFGAAAGSWERSPPLRSRLLAAAGSARSPVFLAYAANDFSVEPGRALAAEMTRRGRAHRLRIYRPAGRTREEGHDIVYLRPSAWERDVFAFLRERMPP